MQRFQNITQGTAWDIVNVGYNDIITFTGWANSDGSMQLTATKTSGVVIDSSADVNVQGDLFCLDSGIELSLDEKHSNSNHCPAGETRVVLAADTSILKYQCGIDAYDATGLISNVTETCDYITGCTIDLSKHIAGIYMTGFASVPYSSSNANITLRL